jgi:hypothetical protein
MKYPNLASIKVLAIALSALAQGCGGGGYGTLL